MNWGFPSLCPVCQDFVESTHSLCPECFKACHFITDPVSKQGIPLPHPWLVEEFEKAYEREEGKSFCDTVRSALCYDDFSSQLIHDFKYLDRLEKAPLLAKFLFQAGARVLEKCDMLIPVPLHRRRLVQRRYNQACILAYALKKYCPLPVQAHILFRKSFHTAQIFLTRRERFKNIQNSFFIKPNVNLKGLRLVLIDDVITTGATVEACAFLLKKQGARHVCALSVLRVLPRMNGL